MCSSDRAGNVGSMVNRQRCTKCGGLGKIPKSDEPPDDPQDPSIWMQCPHCKGTSVEMAAKEFEVFFPFADEVDAREFMNRAADQFDLHSMGIRVVDPEDDPFPGLRALSRGKPN